MSTPDQLAVTYSQDNDGYWLATVPSLEGCHTQGKTLEQARERIREAIQVTLDLDSPFTGELIETVKDKDTP